MAFSHVVTWTIQGGSNVVTSSETYSGTARSSLEETITTGSTDTLITFAIDVSEIASIIIVSDQAIKLETNATDHAGGNEIDLKADVPYVWTTDSYDACLLTADVTKLYITNASGSTATLKIEVLTDATP
jgi:hypothetical protein